MRDNALTEQNSVVQAKILKELLADGRQSESEVAKKIGETAACVKENFGQMKEMGIITGATTHINYKSFGYLAVAHILITVNPEQEGQLIEYLQKTPEIYAFYSRGVKGNLDVVATIKTLEHLNEIKDAIKRRFSVLEMKSAIWTDVKEMNYNLAILNDNIKEKAQSINCEIRSQKINPKTIAMDQIDLKIADKLAENGRIPTETLGKEAGISLATAKKRYERLRKSGILKVTIQINPSKIGYQALCVFFAVTSHENSFEIIEKISRIDDIISIMKTTGDYDLQIYAMVKDLGHFFSVREELGKIQGITKMDEEVLPLGTRQRWPSPRQYISTF